MLTGFNGSRMSKTQVVLPYLPQGLDDVEKLVLELQRRGLFRKDYEATTLRDHLGLPRPSNRFFA